MGKSSKQVVEQRVDPKTAAFRDFVFGRARGMRAGIDPSLQEGFSRLSQIDPAVQQQLQGLVGNLGLASGAFQRFAGGIGAEDIAQFQDPFQEQVTGATISDFQRLRENALRSVGSEATRAGAFGGSRQGIAEAVSLGELGRAEAATLGDIRSRGFQTAVQSALASRGQAMGAAGQLANLGFGGIQGLEGLLARSAGAQIGLGQTRMDLPFRQLAAQSGVLAGAPRGMSTTTTSQGSPFQSLLGAGATIGGFFLGGPAGAAAGSQLAGGFNFPSAPISRGAPQLNLSALQNPQHLQMPVFPGG